MTTSNQLWFERACKVLPGGVNSPVRSFQSVGGTPIFIRSAKGAMLEDIHGNTYIDYIGSWGPMLFGHRHEPIEASLTQALQEGISFGAVTTKEVEMAELITTLVPNIEMIRMVNSGTEAVMSAIRLARGYTGKDKVIKFAGCYHGHSDSMLITSGSGTLASSSSTSLGVPASIVQDTLVAPYNNLEKTEELFLEHPRQIAAVIVEPVAANMGLVLPAEGFLQGLRKLCDEHGALLIFDEVITGFRLAAGGAQEYFGISADLVTYGKIIGGGLPVGAYGGRREVMSYVAPLGRVYQAGTLSGNPLAVAAGLATLREIVDDPKLYHRLEATAKKIADGFRDVTSDHVSQIGALVGLFMTRENVHDLESAQTANLEKYGKLFHYLLKKGIYFAPAQFEAIFISRAHTDEMIASTIQAVQEFYDLGDEGK